jgi:hypothetical protein
LTLLVYYLKLFGRFRFALSTNGASFVWSRDFSRSFALHHDHETRPHSSKLLLNCTEIRDSANVKADDVE